ncbi:MAG: ribonuclease III [Victivallales bacterium]|jgi:ribonuclease III|nr:ribonuclease III [Victivallales bacterium]
MKRDVNELKVQLGEDIAWSNRLIEALTHRSYAVENALPYDNQRLEFLGDAVLEIALTDYLFNLYPDCDEGAMTKMRSALVREPALANLAKKLEFGEYLSVGHGEAEIGGAGRDSTLADLFEAIIGAFYLDAGFERVKRFIWDVYRSEYPDPRSLLGSINPKGLLQEYAQRRWGISPVYSILRTTGPAHLPIYEVEVSLHGFFAFGSAASRKSAESEAARQLYSYLTTELGENE